MTRTTMALLFSVLALVPLVPAWASLPAGLTVEEDVRVSESNYRAVFSDRRFYPGQKITVQIRGTVDADHHYWEERRCSWAGIKCWYEYPESANIVNTSSLPVLLSVRDTRGEDVESLKQAVDPKISDGSQKHFPLPEPWVANQELVLELRMPDAENKWDTFGQAIQIFARIADRGLNNMPVYRNACVGRPPHCGSGAYSVAVTNIDNSERMRHLENLLKVPVPPSTVISALKQDRFLVGDSAKDHQTKLARLLYGQSQLKLHEGTEAEQQYLQYALELDRSEKSVDISNALSKAYLSSGNIAAAKMENEKTFQIIAAEYEKAKASGLTLAVVLEYSKALKTAAQIGSIERGGIHSGDLIKAVGIYVKASSVSEEGLEKVVGLPDKDYNQLVQVSYESLVDASRLLMMMRSHENMEQAERLLEKAVILAAKLKRTI